ncbi:hypothetical protein IFR08_11810 [Pseudomonas fluorescens]|uniref:hypothetical protein n=1 Tax=Pseudomonas fluorescens TaxID=294 RepID=UPI00177DAF51|nr:hypothetical protein [Pseudomonas fluorescens]MBD8774445.1 hypothetical protein [Pseudomonas fluorescens]
MAIVDAEYGTPQFLVSAGDGLCFIEFHNLPTGICYSACEPECAGHSRGLAAKHKGKPAPFDEMAAENN